MTETFHAGPNLGRLSDVTIIHGDCIEAMRELADDSIDAIVCDPPYSLSFMGSAWDTHETPFGFQQWCELWATEALRVLKPGGHMLSFGGTRTWHRLACAVEDAGFEIRDSIAWLYGSGFPKSLDVSKAIDKRPGVLRHPEFAAALRAAMAEKGYTNTFDVAERVVGRRTGAVANWQKYQFPEAKWWPALRDLLDMDEETWGPVIAEAERARVGQRKSGIANGNAGHYTVGGTVAEHVDITAPATPEAERWRGWGTALKPAFEPVVVGRKPFRGNVAANVLAHGTGALNIDACRIENAEYDPTKVQRQSAPTSGMMGLGASGYNADHVQPTYNAAGRWPANVVLDGRTEPVLRLRYNLPVEVERTIRESFGASTGHLPAVRDFDCCATEPRGASEVLLAPVPRSVDVGEPDRGASAALGQAAHSGDAGEDICDEAGQSTDGREVALVEGRTVSESRLHVREAQRATGARAGVVPLDVNPQRRDVHPGASSSGGTPVRSGVDAGRACAPHQRAEGGQPTGEPGIPPVEQLASDEARRGGRGDVQATQGERSAAVTPLEILHSQCPPRWRQYFAVVGESQSQAAALDEQAPTTGNNGQSKFGAGDKFPGVYGDFQGGERPGLPKDKGGASRFFFSAGLSDSPFLYCAKAPKKERPAVVDADGKAHAHPTVKPLALMRWLVRLVTPPGGVVLDPFTGSGTTVEAALLEDFRVIGIERETDYLPLIQQRIARCLNS